jgi:hypothetical protein
MFSPSTWVSSANYYTTRFYTHRLIIWGWYNRPNSGRHSEWTQESRCVALVSNRAPPECNTVDQPVGWRALLRRGNFMRKVTDYVLDSRGLIPDWYRSFNPHDSSTPATCTGTSLKRMWWKRDNTPASPPHPILGANLLTYGAEPLLRTCQLCSHSENSQQF